MKDLFKKFENDYKDQVNSDVWRLNYHLMPPVGWLNDPNGLCEFNGIYHIFYQYSPTSPLGAKKGWGHYSTKDFIHYVKEENALFPDHEIDKDGAYSGSAFIENNQIHFFYTGNIKFEGSYDYINAGRGHYVNSFTSNNGYDFSEKVCLLKNEDYPSDMSCHVRDPKIFKEGKHYYMVLGARTKESVGCLLIYVSDDLKNWKYHTRVNAIDELGYMWECPDLFEINHQKILVMCPQGVEKDGYKYENLYQNGYIFVDGDMNHLSLNEFVELDYGFDFYAPQTFEDNKNRRILIGWMGIPDVPYENPTVHCFWQHALTLPRELKLIDNKIYQYPILEIDQLKTNHQHLRVKETYHYTTHSSFFHIIPSEKEFTIRLRKDIELIYKDHLLTLSLKESGYGRDERHIEIDAINEIDIYSDTSSLEIFINKGEKVMTTRVYDDESDTYLSTTCILDIDYYEMKSFQILEKGE